MKVLTYLVIQMYIAPLCDKGGLAWMPNIDPWEIFM